MKECVNFTFAAQRARLSSQCSVWYIKGAKRTVWMHTFYGMFTVTFVGIQTPHRRSRQVLQQTRHFQWSTSISKEIAVGRQGKTKCSALNVSNKESTAVDVTFTSLEYFPSTESSSSLVQYQMWKAQYFILPALAVVDVCFSCVAVAFVFLIIPDGKMIL